MPSYWAIHRLIAFLKAFINLYRQNGTWLSSFNLAQPWLNYNLVPFFPLIILNLSFRCSCTSFFSYRKVHACLPSRKSNAQGDSNDLHDQN